MAAVAAELSAEDCALLLNFVTSCSKPPLLGFAMLRRSRTEGNAGARGIRIAEERHPMADRARARHIQICSSAAASPPPRGSAPRLARALHRGGARLLCMSVRVRLRLALLHWRSLMELHRRRCV